MDQHMAKAFKNITLDVLKEAEEHGCETIGEARSYFMTNGVNKVKANTSPINSSTDGKKKGKPNKPKEERNPSPHQLAVSEGIKTMRTYFPDKKKYPHKHFLGAGHNIARWTLNGNDKYSEEVIIAVAAKLYNEHQQQMYEETNGEKGSEDGIFDYETVNQEIFQDKSKKSLEEIVTVMKTKKTASKKKTPEKKTSEKKTPEKKTSEKKTPANKGKVKVTENPVYSENEEESNQSSDSDSDSEKSADRSSSKKKIEYSDDSEEEKHTSDKEESESDSESDSDKEDEC
jgi:hypothetical protein